MARGKTISSLNIKVAADASDLKKGVSQAVSSLGRLKDRARETGGTLKGFGERFKSIGSGMMNAGTVVTGLNQGLELLTRSFGAVTRAAQMFAAEFAGIDESANFAALIGTNVQTLQELRFAFSQNGVAAGNFDTALQRMTRRIAEAATGSGEAVGALEELGLDASKLQGLELGDQMTLLAAAFSNVEGESDRLRLAFKLFDTEGARLAILLGKGADELQRLRDLANEKGLILNDEDVDRATSAQFALVSLGSSLDAVRQKVAVQLAPAMETLAELAAEFASELAIFIEKHGPELRKLFVDIATSIRDSLEAVLAVIKFLQETEGTVKAARIGGGAVAKTVAQQRLGVSGQTAVGVLREIADILRSDRDTVAEIP